MHYLINCFLYLLLFITFSQQNKVSENLSENERRLNDHVLEKRNAIRDKSLLWPDGVIIYELYPDFVSTPTNIVGREAILNAMRHIENKTCIRFKKRTNETNFISIQNSLGCASYMGKRGGNQTVNLRIPGCTPIYIAVHELTHAIGFAHAHSRHDRDKYIEIIWDNINVNFTYAFRLLSEKEYLPMTEFDFDSIMLYGPTAYAKSSGLITMKSKVPGIQMKYEHEKSGLSPKDVIAINKLYNNCISRKN